MLVYFADHGSKKRRLRTSEEVGAICIEDRAVVFDFEEEVLDHTLGKFGARLIFLFDEAEDDEVAVPAVHFVEAAAGHDVAIGKIEQAFSWDFGDTHVADAGDGMRQMPHLDVALLVSGGNGRRGFHACGEVKHGRCCYLGIDQ